MTKKLTKNAKNLKSTAIQTAKRHIITVKNAEGDPNTTATILVQNKINYTPKVSVIIPVYNVEQYLRECLDSVINQTLREIEIICVNDGSTDSSLEILKEYAKKDNRITIITQKNLHAGVARNAGLAVAKGEYIHFMDADDFADIKMLENCLDIAEKQNADITIFGYTFYNDRIKKITYSEIPKKDSLDQVNAVPWNKLFKTDFIKKNCVFFSNYMSCNDVQFVYTLLCLADKISIITEPYYFYRINTTTSISSNRGNKIENFLLAYNVIKLNLQKKHMFRKHKNHIYTKFINGAIYELNCCENEEQKKEFIYKTSLFLSKKYQKILNEKLQPQVSIIIPVHNAEQYLEACLQSVLKSMYKNFEVLCINNGSTDNSISILNKFKHIDNRIKVFSIKESDVSIARNYGLKLSKGEYIHFIDADDFIHEALYAELLPIIRDKNLDILMFGHYDYQNNQTKESFTAPIFNRFKNKKIQQSDLIQYFLLACWNKIYKRRFLTDNHLSFPENCKIGEDSAFGAFCAIKRPKFDFVERCYYFYRRDNINSVTNNYAISLLEEEKVYKYIISTSLYKTSSKKIKKAIDLRMLSALNYEVSKANDIGKITAAKDVIQRLLTHVYKKHGKDLLKVSEYRILKEYISPTIPIVMSTDDNCIEPTIVCLYSILQHTKNQLDVFMLIYNLSKENIQKILTVQKKFKNINIRIVDMGQFNLSKFPHISRFTPTVFARYFIPEICSQYDKVVYTDVDVIFCGDIASYYDIPLDGYPLAATPEEIGLDHVGIYNHSYRKDKFNISKKHKYFANGNLIINCDYWRKHDITEKLVKKTLEWGDALICPDLDVMNMVFENNYKKLPFKYCVTVHRYHQINGNKEMLDGYSNPFIIHYSGMKKPWQTKNVLFYKNYKNIFKQTFLFSYKKIVLIYICLPIYLICCSYLKHIKIPLLKLKKHIKSYVYSRSYRGRMDFLNANFNKIIQSIQSNTSKQITNIQNQQNELAHLLNSELSAQKQLFESKYNQLNTAIVETVETFNTGKTELDNKIDTVLSETNSSILNISEHIETKHTELLKYISDSTLNISEHIETKHTELLKYISDSTISQNNVNNRMESNIQNLITQHDSDKKSYSEKFDLFEKMLINIYTAKNGERTKDLEFRTFGDLAHCIRHNLHKIPNDIDLVVGIPRSGIIPAYIIALFMNKKCCSLDEFIAGIKSSNGFRNIVTTPVHKVLIVDDSIYSGAEIARVREKLSEFTDYSFTYMAVYARTPSANLVDVYLELVDGRRVWQWNYLNHSFANRACFDMDGVLCVDPTDEQNDDGQKYTEFIQTAKPLYVPNYKIRAIVTSRLEKYRVLTEKWLQEHNVQYQELIMLDLPSATERQKLCCHAQFKADIYKNMSDTDIFIESNPNQAKEIALKTGKQVLCVENDELY